MKIREYIVNSNQYRVDKNYQRPPGAWSRADEQCFIDTVLRAEPIPLFFLNRKKENGMTIDYIVDGQQRLNCIAKFHANKLPLNQKFSDGENHGKTFNGENPLNDEQRAQFLDCKLPCYIVKNYDDERVRLLFSRLQRGKPLQLGEKLNAKPGTIVNCMRELAAMPFLKKSVGVSKDRHGTYADAARILYYHKHDAKECGTDQLFDFFEKNRDLDQSSKEFKDAKRVLNFLAECFPADPGNYQFLNKHAWVIAVYMMVRELMLGYSLHGKSRQIMEFVKEFHNDVHEVSLRDSSTRHQRFFENIRGGWAETLLKLRRKTLIEIFEEKFPLPPLADRRQISEEEKIAAYSRAGCKCERCGISLKDHVAGEYHHIKPYIDGGPTDIENIRLLCQECHKIIHGKQTNEIPDGHEFEESQT